MLATWRPGHAIHRAAMLGVGEQGVARRGVPDLYHTIATSRSEILASRRPGYVRDRTGKAMIHRWSVPGSVGCGGKNCERRRVRWGKKRFLQTGQPEPFFVDQTSHSYT